MAIEATTKQTKIKKEIESISENVKRTKVKPSDLIVPILLGMVLILLAAFVFIPMVSAAIKYQEEIKGVNEKILVLETLEKSLDGIDQNQISDDIITAKAVIPKILKVSDFIYYVDTLAIDKGLKEKELSAGDITSGSGDGANSGVSGPVEYSGNFNSVLSFLDEVQSSSPYLINIKNVELSKSSSTEEWSVSLNVNGYYMAEANSTKVDLYSPFKVYTTYSDIVDIFRTKASMIGK